MSQLIPSWYKRLHFNKNSMDIFKHLANFSLASTTCIPTACEKMHLWLISSPMHYILLRLMSEMHLSCLNVPEVR